MLTQQPMKVFSGAGLQLTTWFMLVGTPRTISHNVLAGAMLVLAKQNSWHFVF
jgi:hypothetical protein